MRILRHLLIFILMTGLTTGCASGSKVVASTEDEPYQPDLACAYFYFLWGTHAEYDQRFGDALEAFEKALICDPAALFIKKKLPVLLIRNGEIEKAAEWLKEAIAENPEDTSQYLLLAHLSIQQNKRDEAIELYRQVLLRDPENEGVLLRLGILYTQQQQFEEAESIFRNLAAANPELYYARIYLARLFALKGDNSTAATTYEEALKLNWSEDLVHEIVEFYSKQKRHEDVLRLYTTVIDNDPGNERAALGRVQALLALDRNKTALEELRELRKLRKNMPRLDMAISKILLRLDKVDDAEKLLLGLRSSDIAPEANYLLGLIAFQSERPEEALEYLEAISVDDKEYIESVYLQVRILRGQQRYAKSLRLLLSVSENPDSRHPLFYALLATLYQEVEQVEEAMASLTAGTAAFPDNEQLHFEQAILLERIGDHSQAVDAMQRVLALNPDHPEALNFIGYTWADKNINLEKAYDYITRAVELRPENGFIRDSLGWVYFRMGNTERALEELLKALEFEPADPHIYDHLGDVYKALKEPEKAREAYLEGLKIVEDDSQKATMQEKLDALLSE